jgi:hypothetical protein
VDDQQLHIYCPSFACNSNSDASKFADSNADAFKFSDSNANGQSKPRTPQMVAFDLAAVQEPAGSLPTMSLVSKCQSR